MSVRGSYALLRVTTQLVKEKTLTGLPLWSLHRRCLRRSRNSPELRRAFERDRGSLGTESAAKECNRDVSSARASSARRIRTAQAANFSSQARELRHTPSNVSSLPPRRSIAFDGTTMNVSNLFLSLSLSTVYSTWYPTFDVRTRRRTWSRGSRTFRRHHIGISARTYIHTAYSHARSQFRRGMDGGTRGIFITGVAPHDARASIKSRSRARRVFPRESHRLVAARAENERDATRRRAGSTNPCDFSCRVVTAARSPRRRPPKTAEDLWRTGPPRLSRSDRGNFSLRAPDELHRPHRSRHGRERDWHGEFFGDARSARPSRKSKPDAGLARPRARARARGRRT